MCLLVAFDEKEVIEGERWFVGYKIFRKRTVSEPYNNHLGYMRLNQIYTSNGYKIDCKWNEVGVAHLTVSRKFSGIGSEDYGPGFHSFLNKDDAHKYDYVSVYEEEKNQYVCRVLFKDILSIGLNGTNSYREIVSPTRGLCVISKFLYIKSQDWENRELMKGIDYESVGSKTSV